MTRIISSGVTPLATAAATNAPALVPTYTSNSFTVRFTDRRSRARRAPISYTPPVKPPPPRTRADFERWRRRRCDPSRGPEAERSPPAGSSLTTLPMLARIVGRRARTAGFPPPYRIFRPGRGLRAAMRARLLALLGALSLVLAAPTIASARGLSPQQALAHALGTQQGQLGRFAGAYV